MDVHVISKIPNQIRKYPFESILFLILWGYIIARALLVFYVHDELVSKYAYMIDWNPLPFMGYVDANNHFLNSLLGGFFVRLFQSDAIWVCRLPNLLIFPLFYWSIVGFKRFIQKPSSYVLFLIGLSCSVFILDFFSLARGYGLAWAFFMAALLMTSNYFERKRCKDLLFASLFWLLAVYSNFSILSIASIGLLLLSFTAFKQKIKKQRLIVVLSFIPIALAFYYALHLQKVGKLYLGSNENFIETTVQSLTDLMFSIENAVINVILIAIISVVLIQLSIHLYKKKEVLNAQNTFSIFLFLAVLAILFQNRLLDINFPENRAAAYLIFLFYGSIAFFLDRLPLKWLSYIIVTIIASFFIYQINLEYTRTYKYEHLDERLISTIPAKVNGIPTSTGGRYWKIDNELVKQCGFPIMAFQNYEKEEDTLADYVIGFPNKRLKILDKYHIKLVDEISNLHLYERNSFLKRNLFSEQVVEFDSNDEYINLLRENDVFPCFVRCTGKMQNVTKYNGVDILFIAKDSLSGIKYFSSRLKPIDNVLIKEDASIEFDFTYVVNDYDKANQLKVYIRNYRHFDLKGKIRTEVYRIPHR